MVYICTLNSCSKGGRSIAFNHHIVHYNTSKDDVKGFGHVRQPTWILNYYPLGLKSTKCPLHIFLCFLLHFGKNIATFHLGVHVWFAQNLKARFHMQENSSFDRKHHSW
jgi:hypothetical protein